MRREYLVVGAGFSGAVVARTLADAGKSVLVIDERPHIAGNCFTSRDSETGIMVHRYGPHIFNTNSETVWKYVNSFGELRPYINRVKARTTRGIFTLPVNLHTINQFFGKAFTPAEAQSFLRDRTKPTDFYANFEERALMTVGEELYYAFFYGYTRKQWGCEPRELPASLFSRLPVRFTYNDDYYQSSFQGIPSEGYTQIVENILNHSNITVALGVPFEKSMLEGHAHTFYSGGLDRFFDYLPGRLPYRTVEWTPLRGQGDIQGGAVINYPDLQDPFTRIHEHKFFTPWENHKMSVAFVEYSKETSSLDIPYYPKRIGRAEDLLRRYIDFANQEMRVTFLGRLGTFRYLNMDQVIGEALDVARRFLEWKRSGERGERRFPSNFGTHASEQSASGPVR